MVQDEDINAVVDGTKILLPLPVITGAGEDKDNSEVALPIKGVCDLEFAVGTM